MSNQIEDIRSKEIVLLDIDSIKFNPKNRNHHPDDQIEHLARIIKANGFRRPGTISNQSGFLTVGEGRVRAAKLLGYTKVPVMFQDYDSPELEYADSIADNAIDKQSILDFAAINLDLADLGPDFDVDLFGIKNFTVEPLDKINQINSSDENAEWVDMPEFNPGSGYINLIFQFKTELERELYCQQNNITPDMKKSNQWIVHK